MWLTSEAKVLLLPLIPTAQSMLLRYIITCMLYVCNAVDRISWYFDSMVKIMAERGFLVNLSVKILFFYMLQTIWFDTFIPIGQVGTFFCEFNYSLTGHVGHLEKNGRHLDVLRGMRTFFKRVVPKEHMCEIWCLYHNLKDSSTFCHLSAPLFNQCSIRGPTLPAHFSMPRFWVIFSGTVINSVRVAS